MSFWISLRRSRTPTVPLFGPLKEEPMGRRKDLPALAQLNRAANQLRANMTAVVSEAGRPMGATMTKLIALDGTVYDRVPVGASQVVSLRDTERSCLACGQQIGTDHATDCPWEMCPRCGDARSRGSWSCDCPADARPHLTPEDALALAHRLEAVVASLTTDQ